MYPDIEKQIEKIAEILTEDKCDLIAVDMQNVESEHSVLDYLLKKERYANLYKGINMLDFCFFL